MICLRIFHGGIFPTSHSYIHPVLNKTYIETTSIRHSFLFNKIHGYSINNPHQAHYNSSFLPVALFNPPRPACVVLPTYPSTGYKGFPTINPKISYARSAAAQAVDSPRSSYGGATSTTSAPTIFNEVSWRRIAFSSRVVQPPGSGHPVPGARPGSTWR